MKHFFGFVILCFFINYNISLAQEVKNIDTVIISAQRIKQLSRKIPYSSNIYNINTIEKNGSRTTPEALSNTSGVFVQKTTHSGGSAFIRGLTGNQTLLLIDGIRLNNSTFRYGPNQYLNTIDLYSINKIEVLKGTGSVQYGSDALSGVIHLLSKEADFTEFGNSFKTNINYRSVSQKMEKTIYANTVFSNQKFSSYLGISVKKFGDLIGGDTTGKQSPSGYNEVSYNFNAKYKLKSKSILSFGSRLMIQKNSPFYYKYELENYKTNKINLQSYQLNYLKYSLETKSNLAKSITTTLSYQHSIEDKVMQKNASEIETLELNKINTLGIISEIHSKYTKQWTSTTGIELYRDLVGSKKSTYNFTTTEVKKFRGLYPDQSRFNSTSIFTLHQYQSHNITINAGLRFNAFDIHIKDTTLGSVEMSPNAFVYNFGILYQLNKTNAVYANLSTAYRAPNIDDLGTLGIVDFRYETPSLKLKPEQSINIEIGHRYNTNKIQTEVSIFYIRLNEIITRTKVAGEKVSGYDVYIKNNDQTAFIRGFEGSINYLITDNISFSSNISYTYGKNITLNEPLRRIPPMHGMSKLKYEKNDFYIIILSQYASKQTRLSSGDKSDNRIYKTGTEGWSIFDLNVGYKMKNIELSTGIQNIMNKDYRMHGSGINGMGRSFWMNVKVKI